VNVHEEDVAPETGASLRYHWYVYGDVPPVTLELNCLDWPTSIMREEGEIDTAMGAPKA
jgi:hypothetical protein